MTLTSDQLFRLLASAEALATNIVTAGGFPTSGLLSAIAEANQQTLMMETPITAEALKAAGSWTHESPGLYRHDMVKAGDLGSSCLFLDVCADDPPAVYIGDLRLPDVRTMYDLRELVRLLGGENA